MDLFVIILCSLGGAALYLTATHDFEGPHETGGKGVAQGEKVYKFIQAVSEDPAGQSQVDDPRKTPLVGARRQDSSAVITQRSSEEGVVLFAGRKFSGMSADFVRNYIIPHLRCFEEEGATSLLIKVMEFLEEHGDCPSVHLGPRDFASEELYTKKILLAEVHLKEHSYRVAAELIDLVKKKYFGNDDLVPWAAIAGLSHDLGKASTCDAPGACHGPGHAARSAAILKALGSGKNFFRFPEVVKAVREHHTSTREALSLLLKEADSKAREIEHMLIARKHTIKPFSEWFDPWCFMRRLEPWINRIDDGQWSALSYDEVIYCQEDLIYETGRKVCREARALDSLFMKKSQKEGAMKALVSALRDAGFVDEMLPKGRHKLKFEVIDGNNPGYRTECYLIPLKCYFFDFEALEARCWNLNIDFCITPIERD